MSRLIIGITGNIASGKSRVAQRFQEKGCSLIDADKVAHELYATNRGLLQQLSGQFGPEVLHPDGTLNRRRLGAQVFGDPESLSALNRIVHPHLLVAVRERIFSALRVFNRVVLDAALIVEWGIRSEIDFLVLVTAPDPQRLNWLMERDGLTRIEAEQRLFTQMPDSEKRNLADAVIENNSGVSDLNQKAEAVWESIMEKYGE